jgi:putative hydrolase of the HAD superfamily
MIKAVIFDYGNVLSGPQDSTDAEAMAQLTGLPVPFFMDMHSEYREDFDRGLIDGSELYRRILTGAGRSDLGENRGLTQRMAELELVHWRPLDDEAVDWALSLKKAGYTLGILSNMPHEFLTRYEKDIPIFAAADYACFSCRVGLIKPEQPIYEVALKTLAVAPGEAVFFDDLAANINAAETAGIHGVLWTSLDAAKKAFGEIIAAEGGV